MARLVSHRQTKGAEPDRPIHPPPRHIPTLPKLPVSAVPHPGLESEVKPKPSSYRSYKATFGLRRPKLEVRLPWMARARDRRLQPKGDIAEPAG